MGTTVEKVVSPRARLCTAFLTIAFAALGVRALAAPADVSVWADMPAVSSISMQSTECLDSYSAVRSTFVAADGTRYEPAARIGGELTFPSFRVLDRDIAGTFHAEIGQPGESGLETIALSESSFSEGEFESVTAGCRVGTLRMRFSPDFEPAVDRLEVLVNSRSVPSKWRILERVEIDQAQDESWSSEEFWLIPEGMQGVWSRQGVEVVNPFIDGAGS